MAAQVGGLSLGQRRWLRALFDAALAAAGTQMVEPETVVFDGRRCYTVRGLRQLGLDPETARQWSWRRKGSPGITRYGRDEYALYPCDEIRTEMRRLGNAARKAEGEAERKELLRLARQRHELAGAT